jgi:hypothetical protein
MNKSRSLEMLQNLYAYLCQMSGFPFCATYVWENACNSYRLVPLFGISVMAQAPLVVITLFYSVSEQKPNSGKCNMH